MSSDDRWQGKLMEAGGTLTVESLEDTLKKVTFNASSMIFNKWADHESPLIRLIERHKKFIGRPHYGTTDISDFVFLLGKILVKNKYPDYFKEMMGK